MSPTVEVTIDARPRCPCCETMLEPREYGAWLTYWYCDQCTIIGMLPDPPWSCGTHYRNDTGEQSSATVRMSGVPG